MPLIYETANSAGNGSAGAGGEQSISDIILIKADFVTGENIVIRTGELCAEEGLLYGA